MKVNYLLKVKKLLFTLAREKNLIESLLFFQEFHFQGITCSYDNHFVKAAVCFAFL